MYKVSPISCKPISVLVMVIILLFVAGCALKNKTVAEDKRVAFVEKTTTPETYVSGPLTVNYEYQRSGDTLTISGSVKFRQSVDSLDVRLFFLDADGLVVGRTLVYSSGYRSLAARDSTRTFRTQIDVPAEAVGFSFEETSKQRTSMR